MKEKDSSLSLREYHQEIGGRIPRDERFEAISPTPKIRKLIVHIREITGLNNIQISRAIGCSDTTLSMLSQGRAGDVTRPGKLRSTTEILHKRLIIVNSFPWIARFGVFPSIKK